MAVGGCSPLFCFLSMESASKIVSSSIIGLDYKTIFINNRAYMIYPPTIARIAGASYYLSDFEHGDSVASIIRSFADIDKIAHALSWLIKGNDSLFKALRKGTIDEVTEGLETALSMIYAENFCKLSVLAKNVAALTAKQRQ